MCLPLLSLSVKALNWFWSSETKFGTRLQICNAYFAVFSAQSRFTAAEIVCQIPDSYGTPVHCCECCWPWGLEVGGRIWERCPQAPASSYRKVLGRFQNIHRKKAMKLHSGSISRGHSSLPSKQLDSCRWRGNNHEDSSVACALQNGFSSDPEEILGWLSMQSLEILKVSMHQSYFIAVLRLWDNQYLAYSSDQEYKTRRNSSISHLLLDGGWSCRGADVGIVQFLLPLEVKTHFPPSGGCEQKHALNVLLFHKW